MLSPDIRQIDLDIEKIEKGGFPHFMLKEIFEQVYSIKDTIRGRINYETSDIFLGGIAESYRTWLRQNASLSSVAAPPGMPVW